MWEPILNRVYANQAMLGLSNVGQPFRYDDASTDRVRPMSENLLWSIETTNLFQLWIIQFSIIIGTTTLLAFVLRKMHQPKVIAEVLSGIVIGPNVLGRIPGFTERVFPPESRPHLALTAGIGIRLFFFLVGLQIEPFVVKKNLRVSATIALAGMIFPFITGAGLSALLHQQFANQNIQLTYFMFFSGVAFSVTAFPAMCRILTELKLLDTTVGAAVISAGVGNDVIGWIILALSVAFLKAGSSLEAVYIIFSCASWTTVLLFPVKSFLRMLAKTTGSLDNGPSVLFMTIAILILFSSVLVTSINGVHGIFGAFLTGLIIPREGNLATSMIEKLGDMVEIIFLPFYFILLGMSTDLCFLNNGITWVYTISIIVAAFVSKFGSCAIAAKYTAGFSWRESGAIGSFMSCKGLVELIVLDVGLSAGIFTPRVFTMFVLEALVLTFLTTPLVIHFYPPRIRRRTVAERTTLGNVISDDSQYSDTLRGSNVSKGRIVVVLDKVEHLPAVMAFTNLFRPCFSSIHHKRMQKRAAPSIEVLRLVELSDRACAVTKSSDTLIKTDPLLVILNMFGRLHTIPIKPAIDTATYDGLAHTVIDRAHSHCSDLIVLPWLLPSVDPSHHQSVPTGSSFPLGHSGAGKAGAANVPAKPSARTHPHFLQTIFENARTDVAVCIDRNIQNPAEGKTRHHLFLPFLGGPDDRLALDFVVQLCENDAISATVVRLIGKNKTASMIPATGKHDIDPQIADDEAWKYCTSACPSISSDVPLPRIAFKEYVTTFPLHAVIREAHALAQPGTRLLIVVGRREHLQADMDPRDLSDFVVEYGGLDAEVKRTIGGLATAVVAANSGNGVLVLQKAD